MSLFEDDQSRRPERVRVSIIERLIPAVSFGLASISGIVGALLTMNLFASLRKAENAGMDTISEGLSGINSAVIGLLSLSIVFVLVGVVICAVRMVS
jgi:hypothetical protein